MGFSSFGHWLIILLVVLLVFGAGKLPKVMGDLGRGVRSLREGLKGDDDEKAKETKLISSNKDQD